MAKGARERYAKALLEIASEEKAMEKVSEDLRAFSQLLQESQDLKNVLFRKVFSLEDKKEILQEILKHLKPTKTSQNFLFFLVDQQRFPLFFEIEKEFHRKVDELSHIAEVNVFSATLLTKTSQKKMNEQFEKWIGKKARVIYKVDENLIGGMVTKIGNHVYDGSIRTQLHLLEQQLLRGE